MTTVDCFCNDDQDWNGPGYDPNDHPNPEGEEGEPPASTEGDSAGGKDTQLLPGERADAAPGGLPCPNDREEDEGAGSDPVSLFSGEYYLKVEDLRIPGVAGHDLVWSRTYKSRQWIRTDIGNQWDFSQNIRLQWLKGLDPRLLDGSGHKTILDGRMGPADYWANVKAGYELRLESDGTYTLTFPNGGEWSFHGKDHPTAPGGIRENRDRNGNTITYSYSAQGQLEVIHDTLGRPFTITRNAWGLIERVTDHTGRSIVYEYYGPGDPDGSWRDLKSVTTPAITGTPHGNDFPNGRTTTYTYSVGSADVRLNHNLLTITDGRGHDPADPVQSQGPWLVNVYSPAIEPWNTSYDRVIRQEWGGDIVDIHYQKLAPSNSGEKMLVIVNDRGGTVREQYFGHAGPPGTGPEPYERSSDLVRERVYTGFADPTQPTTTTENRPAPASRLRDTDPEFFETKYRTNRAGLVSEIISPNGNVRRNTYVADLFQQVGTWRGRAALVGMEHRESELATTGIDESHEYDGVGLYSCSCPAFATKHVDGKGQETLFEYDERGNRTKITHRDPSMIEDFEYDAQGRLTAHVHPANDSGVRRRDEYTYHSSGPGAGLLHETIVDALGLRLTTQREYDAWGNVIRSTDPRGNDTEYLYNEVGELIRQRSRPVGSSGTRYEKLLFRDANGNIVEEHRDNVAADGTVPSNNPKWVRRLEYGQLNELKIVEEEVRADVFAVTRFFHDKSRHVTLVENAEAVAGNQPDNVVRRRFDERGLLFEETLAPGTSDESTTRYSYDGNGNLVRLEEGIESDGSGARVTTWEIDGFNRRRAVTDPMGNRRAYTYDDNGNVETETLWGELVDATGSAGNIELERITRQHDEMDRLKLEVSEHFDPATGATIGDGERRRSFVYTPAGDVHEVVNDRGGKVTVTYDTARRELTRTDPAGNVLEYQRDANGNVRTLISTEVGAVDGTNTYTTHFEYDEMDRLIRLENDLNHVHQRGYDSDGNLELEIDARGNATRHEHDGRGRLLETRREIRQGGTGAGALVDEIVTRQTWDLTGRLVAQVDGNDHATTYHWDGLDRLKEIEHEDGTSRIYTYRGDGTIETILDEKGQLVTLTVDELGRVTRSDLAGGGSGLPGAITFEAFLHDGRGNVVRATNSHSAVNRAFDSLGNMVVDEIEGIGRTTTVHDGEGALTAFTHPSGRQLTYFPEPLGRLGRIEESGVELTRYAYSGPARRSRRTDGNGTGWDTYYDEAGRPSTSLHGISTGPAQYVLSYDWDGDGNKTHRNDSASVAQTFHYDSVGRLEISEWAQAAQATQVISYALDAVGNRQSVSGGPDAGTYYSSAVDPVPADFQVNQYTTTPFASLTRDNAGNLTSEISTSGSFQTHAYDFAHRLIRFHDFSTGQTVDFDYDAFGRRIRKRVNAFETRFAYFGGDVVEETDGLGVVTTYVHGEFVDEVVQMRRGGVDYFLRGDDQNSVTTVTDATGAVVERYRYRDYGLPLVYDGNWNPLAASTIGNPYLFTGRRFDPETGLYFYRSRYLSPRLGRFTGRDSLGAWGDPANLGNALAYVGNNPWSRVDPTGNFGMSAAGDFASGVLSGIGGGLVDSLKSVWDTAKSLATDPKGMWNDMKAGISALSDLVASGDLKEVLGSLAPEVSQLIACWTGASDFSRGEMVGNVLGQHGPDVIVAIVTGGASLGATAAKGGIKALKTLKRLAKRGSCSFLTGTLVLTPSGLVAMEEVPLGGRVVTAEDEGLLSRPGDTLAETEDEVSSWLRVKATLPSTSGAEAVELDLLRPVWWLADVGLIREGWVELRKPVLGRMGAALVESIEHAPDLADGTGSAVVGRIRHDAGWLAGIRFEETHELALVTVGQTFWSESHQAWLSADRLRPGMVVLGGAGPLTVASTSHFRAPGHEVVDLEVLGADGMLVGPRLVAAHNCGGTGKAAGAKRDSVADGLRLKKNLASQQQLGELIEGGGEVMAGAGGRVPIKDVDRLVAKYGGDAGDWAKVRSSNYKAADGSSLETHAYRNVRSGEVFEPKTKFR